MTREGDDSHKPTKVILDQDFKGDLRGRRRTVQHPVMTVRTQYKSLQLVAA